MPDARAATRRPTDVALPEALIAEARGYGVNVSQACEQGLAAEIAAARRRAWLAENQAAMAAWNTHVAEHGLPLDAHRQF